MKRLTVRQARQALTHLDELLAEAGELTITRRDEPIARVLPVRPRRRIPSHRTLRLQMARMSQSSQRLVREDRDER
jgi:antitoxin (DNA-binding transcriptional repressor) of toxin-antitoxin stability system